ncbi:MAG: polymerase sigma-C factor [Actinomycetota bacterium]
MAPSSAILVGASPVGQTRGVREPTDRGASELVLAALVEAAREGDDAAVARLVRATQPAVWRLCQALGSDGNADDLVQETYLRAFSSLATYRGEAPVTVWLLSIARRVCADDVRRRARRRRVMERLVRHTSIADSVAPAAHELAVDSDVDRLLELLEPERREAFVLTQVLGLEYAAAAEVMGCPIGTVRSRVARARGDLIAMVERQRAL